MATGRRRGTVDNPAPDERSGLEAFSSEVETGSREENAPKQESRASVLIQSEAMML
jgi:hypothetical protein